MDASLRVMVVDGIRKTVLLFSQSIINDCKWMLGRWIWPVNAFVFHRFVFLFALVFMVVTIGLIGKKKPHRVAVWLMLSCLPRNRPACALHRRKGADSPGRVPEWITSGAGRGRGRGGDGVFDRNGHR